MGPRAALKYLSLIAGNAALAGAAYYAALVIRFTGAVPERNLDAFYVLLPAILLFHGLAGIAFGTFGRITRVHGLALISTLCVAWVFREETGAFPTSVAMIGFPLVVAASWMLQALAGYEKISFGTVLLVASGDRARKYREWLGGDAVEIEWISDETRFSQIRDALREGRYHSVVTDRLPVELDRLLALLYAAEAGGAALYTAPENHPANEWILSEPLTDRPLIEIRCRETPLGAAFAKRAFDIVAACLVLPLAFPLAVVLSRRLARESPGPMLYHQRRLGWRTRPFEIIKLRTMPVGIEDETGPVWASEDDERATSFGRVLRRFGLDELPQIINVLRGEMSIVGPRPERDHFATDFHELGGRRLLVKPGLTGLAQIQLRKDAPVEEKIRYDAWYIRHRSLWLDVWISYKTATKLWSRMTMGAAVCPPAKRGSGDNSDWVG